MQIRLILSDFADGNRTVQTCRSYGKDYWTRHEGAPFFGLGFPKVVYQHAVIIELGKPGVKCRAEVEKDVYYEEHFTAKRRLDLLAEDKVLIELKAISELDKASHNKIINFLRVFKIEVGLLLNFGIESLPYKRFVNTKMNQ